MGKESGKDFSNQEIERTPVDFLSRKAVLRGQDLPDTSLPPAPTLYIVGAELPPSFKNVVEAEELQYQRSLRRAGEVARKLRTATAGLALSSVPLDAAFGKHVDTGLLTATIIAGIFSAAYHVGTEMMKKDVKSPKDAVLEAIVTFPPTTS
jgi:hypothetical protein